MSMNIAPQIPQVVVNASAPTTEALANANANKEAVPATVQVEPYAPQKSREQEARSSVNNNEDPGTYEDIRNNNNQNNQIISEDEQQSDEQTTDQQNASGEQSSSEDEQTEQQEQAERQEAAEEKQQETQDQRVVDQLKSRDREVRAHEQAHAAVGGSLAGSPSYEYQTGPDGKKYAVGGEVSIDVSKTNDPEATIRKMQTVRAAALAPAEPSSQDRKVAAEASRNLAEARAELVSEKSSVQQAEESEDSEQVEATNNGTENQEEENSVTDLATSANDSASNDNNSEQQSPQYPAEANLARNIRSEDDERTAQVVSQRYASSYQQSQNFFTAVA